jgi:cbb3-type cytochrome oxidase maturation protein
MNLLYIMVPMAILLGAGFLGAFIWATKKGQFDDLDTPSRRMLNDD